jgi:hypothetical protein
VTPQVGEHSAAGPALGYVYQFQAALLELIPFALAGRDVEATLEVFDDVAFDFGELMIHQHPVRRVHRLLDLLDEESSLTWRPDDRLYRGHRHSLRPLQCPNGDPPMCVHAQIPRPVQIDRVVVLPGGQWGGIAVHDVGEALGGASILVLDALARQINVLPPDELLTSLLELDEFARV